MLWRRELDQALCCAGKARMQKGDPASKYIVETPSKTRLEEAAKAHPAGVKARMSLHQKSVALGAVPSLY